MHNLGGLSMALLCSNTASKELGSMRSEKSLQVKVNRDLVAERKAVDDARAVKKRPS